MALTDNQIKGFKPAATAYQKADGGGLMVFVTPTGAKSFRTRYRFDGKQKMKTHGLWPGVTLAEARRLRDQTKALVAKGIDPMAKGPVAEIGEPVLATASGVSRERLFSTVADEWWHKKKLRKTVASNVERTRTRVFDYLVAPLAGRAVDDIAPLEILAVIQRVEREHGVATARRVYGFARQIFAYAKVTRGLPSNPASDLGDGLSELPPTEPRPFLDLEEVPAFYRALRDGRGRNSPAVIALELYMHTVLRNKELRLARWENIKGNELHIPEGVMKKVKDQSLAHVVPLSRQSLALLARLHKITGESEWLFPKEPNRIGERDTEVMSENTTRLIYKAIGYEGRVCNHGWKKTFSTAANESGLWNSDWIEFQLAHHGRGGHVRAVYNKAQYLKQRHEMMQWWSDQLTAQERAASEALTLEIDLADILG